MINTDTTIKRIFALHDLSCFGRCALTVIIPTLASLGLQVIPVPTALLSTHTGGFQNMYFHDLSDDMQKIKAHFQEIHLYPNAIYSGFLGSEKQIDIVLDYIKTFASDKKSVCPVIVDPVMGDDGEIYSTYTKELVFGMRSLCEKADIITPNLTEACLLTDTAYKDCTALYENDATEFAHCLCGKMYNRFGTEKIALTGIHFAQDKIGTYIFERNEEKMYSQPSLPKNYPGTGDIFASVLTGKYLSGNTFTESVATASKFVHDVIEYTMQWNTPIREGVLLEGCLNKLY